MHKSKFGTLSAPSTLHTSVILKLWAVTSVSLKSILSNLFFRCIIHYTLLKAFSKSKVPNLLSSLSIKMDKVLCFTMMLNDDGSTEIPTKFIPEFKNESMRPL